MFSGIRDVSRRHCHWGLRVAPGVIAAQYRYELAALVNIYQTIKPEYVVEIGTHQGGTLFFWLKHAPRGAHIISVDLGPDRWKPAQPDFDTGIWRGWVPDGVHLHIITGNSQSPDIVAQVGYICPRIDFLFIDGDHSYGGAKADFETYGPKVRRGGAIALHDLITPNAQPHIQIGRLWSEIKQAGYLTKELYSCKAQDRGGIGVVFV